MKYQRLQCTACNTLTPYMMRCPMCSHEASSYADNCPGCGHPLRTRLKRAQELKARDAAAIVGLVLFIIWAFLNWPKIPK
jgi:rRNA maturation endonuclease Nob1